MSIQTVLKGVRHAIDLTCVLLQAENDIMSFFASDVMKLRTKQVRSSGGTLVAIAAVKRPAQAQNKKQDTRQGDQK